MEAQHLVVLVVGGVLLAGEPAEVLAAWVLGVSVVEAPVERRAGGAQWLLVGDVG